MANNKVVEGIKFGVSTIAGIGVTILMSSITGSVIAKANTNAVKKMCMIFGASVLSAMVATKTERYLSSEIDSVANMFDAIGDAVKSSVNAAVSE